MCWASRRSYERAAGSLCVLTLAEVLEATGGQLRGARAGSTFQFSKVIVDSRAVAPGALFVALKGQKHDGHTFVAQTLANGAAGVLVERVPPDCAWANKNKKRPWQKLKQEGTACR